jgi:hypothetical protein
MALRQHDKAANGSVSDPAALSEILSLGFVFRPRFDYLKTGGNILSPG